ncbi:MAG TPA: sigma-70 family RNA polymerase sigma factor [Verrucomicrobiae bacterium]
MNATQADKTETFMALRPLLHSVAYQMLGRGADAEDMVQECFVRWERTDAAKVRSPKAFLTTIVTRLCLKQLGSARAQREECVGAAVPDFLLEEQMIDPSDDARLADSLSVALLVLLRALSPVERAVFLLREVFDCDYDEVARMVDRTEENCRQILRRARERVASRQPRYEVLPQQEEQVMQRFLQAAADGDCNQLLQLLSESPALVCDASNLNEPGPVSVSGPQAVIDFLLRKASAWLGSGALLRTICFQGRPVVLAYRDGLPVSSIFVTTENARIKTMCVITCPVRLRSLLIQPGFHFSRPDQ